MEKNLAEQSLVEHKLLNYLMQALRETLRMETDEFDFSHKLSALRFMSQSFQRHLERLLALKELDGYLDVVLKQTPHLAKEVDELRDENDRLRNGVRRIVHRLEQTASNDHAAFGAICDDLIFHVKKLESHNQKEVGLIQEALDRDGGGEG